MNKLQLSKFVIRKELFYIFFPLPLAAQDSQDNKPDPPPEKETLLRILILLHFWNSSRCGSGLCWKYIYRWHSRLVPL